MVRAYRLQFLLVVSSQWGSPQIQSSSILAGSDVGLRDLGVRITSDFLTEKHRLQSSLKIYTGYRVKARVCWQNLHGILVSKQTLVMSKLLKMLILRLAPLKKKDAPE